MPRLATPGQTAAILRKFGFRLSRALGQNFLVDENVLAKIVVAARIQPDDSVVEVGAGIGTLTVALAERAGRVIAVEIDRRLMPALTETTAAFSNISLILKDAMELSAADLKINGRNANKMVSNLPYSIATPLLIKFLREFDSVVELVVMVQREIADRLLANPGSKAYGAATVKINYFATVKWLFSVSRFVFMPVPNVDSAVIRLTRRRQPPVSVDANRLFAVVEAAFRQRRKRLVNALASDKTLGVSKQSALVAVTAAGLEPGIRGESLSTADFGRLAELLLPR